MAESDLIELLESLHPLESKVLLPFESREALQASDVMSLSGLDESRLDMATGWLKAKGLLDVKDESVTSLVSLTEAGRGYLEKGTPEMRIIGALREGRQLTVKDVIASWGMEPAEVSSAVGALKESGAVRIVQGGVLELAAGADVSAYEFLLSLIKTVSLKEHAELSSFSAAEQAAINANFHKRGKSKGIFRITEKRNRSYYLTPAGSSLLGLLRERGGAAEEFSALTPEMLKQGTWRNRKFRAYNIALNPPRQGIGRKHPYKQFLDFVKYKFIGMGFEEMRGPLVENEFWDMDALFMPQFHPARNIHDVYFVKEPAACSRIEGPFGRRVAATHRDGGKTGSTGWRYDFDLERAKRLILRSQGTAVSARTLASGPGIPGKYFSIARCFRYDAVDATHAPDFYQVEGIVLGEEINFRALLGLLTLFGREIAKAAEFQFRPAYFPFTEPSVELHVRHPELGWMELGGAGIFRPEVTAPLGVSVPVIAWGLGLDRMAMVALGIQDIRDLFSRDLDFVRTKKILLG